MRIDAATAKPSPSAPDQAQSTPANMTIQRSHVARDRRELAVRIPVDGLCDAPLCCANLHQRDTVDAHPEFEVELPTARRAVCNYLTRATKHGGDATTMHPCLTRFSDVPCIHRATPQIRVSVVLCDFLVGIRLPIALLCFRSIASRTIYFDRSRKMCECAVESHKRGQC